MKITPRVKSDLKKYLLQRTDGVQDVEVVSAHKLSSSELKEILSKVGVSSSAEPELVVDEELLAGVVVRQGSRIIDLSLAGLMRELQTKAQA